MIEMEKGMILNQKSPIQILSKLPIPIPFLSHWRWFFGSGSQLWRQSSAPPWRQRWLPRRWSEDLKSRSHQGTKVLEKLLEKVVNHGFQHVSTQSPAKNGGRLLGSFHVRKCKWIMDVICICLLLQLVQCLHSMPFAWRNPMESSELSHQRGLMQPVFTYHHVFYLVGPKFANTSPVVVNSLHIAADIPWLFDSPCW